MFWKSRGNGTKTPLQRLGPFRKPEWTPPSPGVRDRVSWACICANLPSPFRTPLVVNTALSSPTWGFCRFKYANLLYLANTSHRLQTAQHPRFLGAGRPGRGRRRRGHRALSVSTRRHLTSGGPARHRRGPSRLQPEVCSAPAPPLLLFWLLPSLGRDFLSRVSKVLQSEARH